MQIPVRVSVSRFLALVMLLGMNPFAAPLFLFTEPATAQTVSPPDRDYLFEEDRLRRLHRDPRSARAAEIAQKKQRYQKAEKAGNLPFDINARNLQYDTTGTKMLADGGLIITYSSMILEAMRGVVDITTSEAQVKDEVRITDVTGSVVADEARLDLKTGAGTMKNADIHFAEGDFHITAEEAARDGDDTYVLKDTTLTTCQCADDPNCAPWRIRARDGKIVKNGYGQVWGATLEVFDVPIFYTPYLLFPAKAERQSGFLPATFGQGSRTGFEAEIPLYLVLDDSSDMTLRPIYHSRARLGGLMAYRQMFSEQSNIDGQFLYFDETARDGRTLGSNISVLEGDKLPTDRYGGELSENWRGDILNHEFRMLVDAHAVSDDLLLREYERTDIAPYNARYLTSRAVMRTELPLDFSLNVSSEYNQLMTGTDNLLFQKLPEGNINGLHSFHPFGENTLGLKLVSTEDLDATRFHRLDQYEGTRYEATEAVKFPFHFRNYFDGQIGGDVKATHYQLSETDGYIPDPDKPGTLVRGNLEENSGRVVPGFSAKIGTVLEKVFDVEKDNPLKGISELGRLGRTQELQRLKHTLEPGIAYRAVPYVDQKDNPQFDANDHLAQRNVVTYGLTQRLYGRYEPRNQYLYGIEEVTPSVNNLGNLRSTTPVNDKLGFGIDDPNSDFQRLRIGSMRELGNFKLSQSYSFLNPDDIRNNTTTGSTTTQASDILADASLFPNEYVSLHAQTNYNYEFKDFDSYTLEGQLRDKRGDEARARFNTIGQQVRQIQTNLEFSATDYTKVGFFANYDDIGGKFIENRTGLRFLSSCKCWTFDVDVVNRLNPDQTSFLMGVSLVGLGELNQRVFSSNGGSTSSGQ